MCHKYDIVIIGSGLGGLECAVMLAKEGKQVCLLEQSHVFGGCLQSFSRRKKTIDTGIHYIGSMGEGQIMRQYLKYFDVLDRVQLQPLDSDFDVMRFGTSQEFSYQEGYDQFYENLVTQFPLQKEGLRRYCDKIRKIGKTIDVNIHQKGQISSGGIEYLGISAAAFIAECVDDVLLQNILAGTNVLYGGIKESSNLYHHAMINHSNIEGSYRFVDGTQQLADALVDKLLEHGGIARSYTRVEEIEVEHDRVVSVRLSSGERVFGNVFISNLHPQTTFNLVGNTPVIKKAYKSRLALLQNTYGLFSVYMTTKPESFPYINKNYYYYKSNNVWDTLYDLPKQQPGCVMLSNQRKSSNPLYADVVTLMMPMDITPFSQWMETSLGSRGEEYVALKEMITQSVIDYSVQFCPALKEAIDNVYSASPLTFYNYTASPGGSAYGIVKDFKSPMTTLLPVKTKLKNLLLTGQNLNVHGALGVTLTAAATCAQLLGTEYIAKKVGGA